jgi:hypothetical protein
MFGKLEAAESSTAATVPYIVNAGTSAPEVMSLAASLNKRS